MKALLLCILPLASIGPAAAAALSCQASVPVVPVLSQASTSSLVGDLFINCTGGTPIADTLTVPQVNFTVFLNIAILGTTEPLLVIDGAGTVSNPTVLLCPTPLTGCTGPKSGDIYDGSAGHWNEFDGVSTVSNAVEFIGVPFDPPGASGTLSFEFENITVNPSVLPSGFSVQSLVSINGSTSVPLTNIQNEIAVVAAPEPSGAWLLGVGMVALACMIRRRFRDAALQ